MNPIFDRKSFVADPEAHKMSDGRLYVYGSLDISGKKDYCSQQYKVFSTDDPKVEKWTDHGISFSNAKGKEQVAWRRRFNLYAPDAIEKDGKYYLYLCGPTGYEGVAISENPEGPFCDAKKLEYADGDGIDPAVFVDDDGQGYLLWGQFKLRGAKLTENMQSIQKDSIRECILSENEHGFHEGASLRKRNGKYYIVFCDISRGKATCLSYAMSDNPLGPYEKKGTIIDNCYCDPSSWNNHGSIEEYNGQWYVFYHRCSQDMRYSRRACVEKIFFNEDGTINEVEMTSQGASDPIDAFSKVDASIACRVKGCYIGTDEEGLNGEVLVSKSENEWLGNWAEYKYLNFGKGATTVSIYAKGSCDVKLVLPDGNEIAKIHINSDDYKLYTASIPKTEGIQPLWLIFNGEASVVYFEFKQ